MISSGYETPDSVPPPSNARIPVNRCPQRILKSPETPYVEKHLKENFLDDDELREIRKLLEEFKQSGKFAKENEHSVLLFGKPYFYTGSKTSETPDAIPDQITKIAEKITDKLNLKQSLNSVLINRFAPSEESSSPESFLSKHSDDEPVIEPMSNIITLSLGGTRKIEFESIHDPNEANCQLELVDNSLYSMTRSSQAWYRHGIPADENAVQERFSITFRTIDERLMRSIIVQGDSNTKDIIFGQGTGKVGASYPGARIKAANIRNVDPQGCIGYSNIFICSGTNDLRPEYIRSEQDVHALVREMEGKIGTIRQLCPKSKIFVVPVLPTRTPQMNKNVMLFNSLTDQMLGRCFGPDIWFPGIYNFLDGNDMLSARLSRGSDPIHLGPKGIAKYVTMLKHCVFKREKYDIYGHGRREPLGRAGPPGPG